MEKWYVTAKKADFDKWAKQFEISPILARIIRNRDILDEQQVEAFLNGTIKDCYSPWLLCDMEKAVFEIENAIEEGVNIRVIGDYDVDGICSSYILTKGLQLLGAKVDTTIPHRIHDGYGLNDNLIEEAYQDGIGMVVTCDNGIAAYSQVELANQYGMRVIITDHHEVPFVVEREERKELLPPALAIVDPKRREDTYPFPNICGAVVAYKLIQALLERTKSVLLKESMEELLEFAAIATVCDVMELRDENRIIVKEGLSHLRDTQNQGLQALLEVNGLGQGKITAYHLGFVIGPCLNATGRLDTAHRALELLQSSNKVDAMTAASELKDLNESRKNLTLQGVKEAERYLENNQMQKDKVLVIYLPDVHESLAGIIAGRIREKYNRPVFLLTLGEEGVKGSGRSIEAYHMYEAMTEVKEFFTKFGGHKLAAGCSMKEENVGKLREELNLRCKLTEEDFIPKVHIDVPMPLVFGTEQLAKQLERLEPFGVGNPKPLFAQKDLIFCGGIYLGKNKSMAKYRVLTKEGVEKELLFFGDLQEFAKFLNTKFGPGSDVALYEGKGSFPISVVYQMGLNTYRGRTMVQFIMQYFD